MSLGFFHIFVYLLCVFSSVLENGIAKKHKRIVHLRMWLWSYSSSEGLHWSPIKLKVGSQATGKFTYRHE